MKNQYITIACLILLIGTNSCTEHSHDTNEGTPGIPYRRAETGHGGALIADPFDNSTPASGNDVDTEGRCRTGSKGTPGTCGCAFEDKDIDGDGRIDCPVRSMPTTEKMRIPLNDITDEKCAEWEYPTHPTIGLPDLPEFGYEITIDTQKYGISTVYAPEQAESTTRNLERAIREYKDAGYTRIVIPPGHYPITPNGIKPANGVALIMREGVILQQIPSDAKDCGIIDLNGVQNVYIEGGALLGDRDHRISEAGEECNGIRAVNGGRYFLNGIRIDSPHGDGIMIVDYTPDGQESPVHDITIANCEIVNAYRNGIAVVGADGVRITNNAIHHTHGTDPQFAIDLEANSRSRRNQHIVIDYNSFHDNVAGDVIIDAHNTFIEYNLFSQGDMDKYIDNPFIPRAKSSSFIFYGNRVERFTKSTGCGWQLFCSYAYDKGVIPTEAQQPYPSFVVNNDLPNTRVQLTYRNRLCVKGNTLHGGHLSASDVKQLRVLNNRVEKFDSNATAGDYSFLNVYGKASGNELCKRDSEGNESCHEVTSLNAMKDDERFDLNKHMY